ncbi:MAG TPA: S-layer homology domain-containing protein [Bacillota bacterium]|nr:S-layer homology domain-containing protein [Bacillota bacterium]HPT87406.1 S-layer homology domain-containing protein [Bacillota bacterium]
MNNLSKWGLVLGVTVLLLISIMTCALAAANPVDVPPNHWAYQAVKQLVDKGYLALYQDQTFRGDQPVDRYTLATVVAKILKEGAAGSTAASREDVKLLRSLTNEFREELVKVLTENSSLSKQLDELTRQDQIFKEDITKLNAGLQNVTQEQMELEKEIQQIITDLLVFKKRVEQLENEVAILRMENASLKEANRKHGLYIAIAIILGLAGCAQ